MMVFAWSYAVAVNFVPAYRNPADKIGDSKVGIENVGGVKNDEEAAVQQVESSTAKETEAELDTGGKPRE